MNIKQITEFQVVKKKKLQLNNRLNFELVKNINELPKNLSICGDWTKLLFRAQ